MHRRYAEDAGKSWRKSWGGKYVDENMQAHIEQRVEARMGRVLTFWSFCVAAGAIAALLVR